MKTQFRFGLLAALFFTGTIAVAGMQSDPTEEVPGDNFSLEGALELFKKSASPQEFEQLLNSANSKVNNLDLNGDGETDYIRVIDRADGNIHTFTLQALVSGSEAQDIAVIELEKHTDGTAVLQIVGDADIYGIETIIEPTQEVRVNAGTTTARTVVNVWAWPSVQYVYGPSYSLWVSPWYWSYYPGWWSPWRPIAWYSYDPYWAPYRPYYSMCYSHRVYYAPRLYRPYRTASVIVYNRHHNQVVQYRSSRGYHRDDRSSSYGRSGAYDNSRSRSRSDNTAYNGSRADDNSRSRSFDRERASRYAPPATDMRERTSTSRSERSYSTGRNSSRTFDSNSSNRSSESNNNSQRPSRQFEPQERRESSPSESRTRPVFKSRSSEQQRSVSPPSDGGSRQRSFSAPADRGGQQKSISRPSDGGSRQRSFSAPSGGGGHQRSVSPPSGGGGSRQSAPSGGGSSGGSRRRN